MIFRPNVNTTSNSNELELNELELSDQQRIHQTIGLAVSVRRPLPLLALMLTMAVTVLGSGRYSYAQEQAAGTVISPQQKTPQQKKPAQSALMQQDPASSLNQQDSNQNARSAAIVNEIKSIRSQLGGGVAGQLEGLFKGSGSTYSEGEMQDEFEKELGRMIEPKNMGSTNGAVSELGGPVVSALPVVGRGAIAPPSRLFSRESTKSKMHFRARLAVSPQAVSLRSAARHLEAAAADLEGVGSYSEADHLREQAKSLWRRARRDAINELND